MVPLSPTQGLVAAAVTSFHRDFRLDLDFVGPMAQHLFKSGVSGVFVNGTTGEGMSLTVEEREAQAEEWRKQLAESMRLFVHVGTHALPDAQRLAAHAQSIGADAIAALAPGFFKPAGVPGVVDWCAEIAAAAPEVPFYFYHMPSMNGVSLRVCDFLRSAEERIPNLAGVKFTFEALDDYLLCTDCADARYDILWGRDEMLLAALATGAKGAVGSTYNLFAPLYLSLIQAFEDGNLTEARRLQSLACGKIVELVQTGNFFGALKNGLQEAGLPLLPIVRHPLPAWQES